MRSFEPIYRQEKTASGNDAFFQPATTIRKGCKPGEEQSVQRKETAGDETIAGDKLEEYVSDLGSGGQSLPGEVRNFYEPRFGHDFSQVKVHTDNRAARSAQSIRALAYTSGNNIVFNDAQYAPGTDNGKRLLGHELTHVVQQRNGLSQKIQREDWDFTPDDYKKLTKGKKDLSFASDSDWVPKALQENILTTIKFVLTSTKPVRTAGINTKDFYHGHLVVPKDAASKGLREKTKDTRDEKEYREDKATGGKSGDVNSKNLKDFIEATVAMEKLSTSLVNDAIAVKGAAVIYHTFEVNNPQGVKAGSDVRNIKTVIGGSPAGFSLADPDSAAGYTDEYFHVLQFAFLVDENGVIHVTVGTTTNLSRVEGKPLGLLD